MYKYSFEILQELSTQRPTSKHSSSRYFSTEDQHKTVKESLNPKDKQLKSYVLTKINKIQAKKQILLAKNRKALLWYRMVLEKMVTPLIELLPDVASSRHLSKLTDFRTRGGYSEQTEEANNKIIVRPKCVEEPLPILIKPEYKLSKKGKKGWRIISKLEKARDSKDEMLNKYKLWKDKVVEETENQSKVAKSTEDKSPGLMVYELFLQDAVESKIENLIPTIKVKDEQSNLYDFRLQDERTENERCENNLLTDEKVVASPAEDTNSKTDKSINHGKTVITKLPKTKNKTKTDPVSVKAKLYDQSSLKNKNETVQVVKVPPIHSKDKNQVKLSAQRTLPKQNFAKNDNRMRAVKSEEVKDKPVVNKTIASLSKNKKPQVIQPTSSNSSAENKTHISTVGIEGKESGKEVSYRKFSGPDNFLEPFPGKSNRPSSDLGVPQDGELKVIENMLDETKTSGINVITSKNTDEKLKLEYKDHQINNSEGTFINNKVETAVDGSLGKSDSLWDFKSNIIGDEKNVHGVSATPQDNVGFTYERNVDPNRSQINNQNKNSTIATESENKNTLGCELTTDPGSVNTLTTENTSTLSNNELKTTYLVSFEVNDDEGFLKTRTQVVSDKIVGDSIDLDTILEQEKKARERSRVERLPENANGADVNVLLDKSKRELGFHNKDFAPRSTDKNIEIKKVVSSAMEQDVKAETPKNNIREINSFPSNSTYYTNKYTQALKGSNISNNNSDKKDYDTIKNSDVIVSERQKKILNKTRSPTGQEKKGKVKEKKVVVLEKEKNILSRTADSKKLNIVNTGKTKDLDRSEKYQEIINSVKNIIPRSNSNESVLEGNVQKIVPSGTKTMNTDNNTIKKYSKTINELKEIINELPRSDEKQAIAASKPRRLWTNKNKNNTSGEGLYKTAMEENIALMKENVFDTKNIGIQANNKSKRINLKKIKIVNKIEKVNEELKPLSVGKNHFEETMQVEQEKRQGQLKLPKSNPFIDNKMASKSLDFLNKQKEYLEENSTILNPKMDTKKNPLKQKTLSNLSEKNPDTPSDEFFKRTSKAKSAINFKSKIIDNSLEPNKSKRIDLPLARTGELSGKTLDKDHIKNKSGDKTNAVLEENRPLVSTTENNKEMPSKAEKIKLPIENFSKSAKKSFVNQKNVIKFTRSSKLGLVKSNQSENDMIKTGGKDILSVNTVKGTPNESMEVMHKQKPEVEVTPQKISQNLSNELKDNSNSGSKIKKEMLQPTGTLAKRQIKVKVESNVKPKRNILSSELDVSGNMLQKSGGENRMQVNSIEKSNEKPQISRRLKTR